MKQAKNNSGFTLLEMMITVTIIGILASAVSYGMSAYVRDKRSEQHVVTLWSELSTLRSRAIKDDCPYLVVFDDNAGTYTVYQDTLGNYNIANAVVVTKAVGEANNNIIFGKAQNTGSLPTELTTNITPVGTNISGQWKSYPNKITGGGNLMNTIVFENDEIGTISNGIIYLKNTAVSSRGYAIVKPVNGHTLKLMKWDGSQWYEL